MYYNHIRVQLARSKLLDEVNMEKKLNKKLTKNVHWNMLRLAFRITFTVLYCTDFLLSESYISPSIFSYLLRQIPTLFILMVKNSLAVNRTICYHFIYILFLNINFRICKHISHLVQQKDRWNPLLAIVTAHQIGLVQAIGT